MPRPKKTNGDVRQKTVSFRLPQPLMEQLRNLARQNRRTLSGEVQLALEKHLEINGSAQTMSANPPAS